ncbi:MAG: MATE family efflux transporter [Ruminococcus sp.]|nr:MATE family efflux transporter [Ruminococcus sp.]
MSKLSNTEIFENTPIPRAVTGLAVPTVMSSLVMVLYSLADTWFVGLLNDPVQNSAVTLAAPVLLAFNAVNNLFGVGASSMMGRALGRKDYDTAKRSCAFGIWAAAVSGVIFSLAATLLKAPLLTVLGAAEDNIYATSRYLYWTVTFGAAPSVLNVVLAYLVRTEGSAVHASIGTMGGCFINIILDPFFVLPRFADMGAAGAGLATFIANSCACLYFFVLIYVRRKTTYVCISPRMAFPKRKIVMGVCGVGVPAAVQNLLNVTGMTVLNNFTSGFGSNAVAAMGISYKIYMIPMQASWGLTSGIMPLISYNYGSGNYKRAKSAVTFTAKISVIFLTAVTAAFYIFSGELMELFIKNREIVAYGSAFLRGMCLAIVFQFVDFLGVAVFQACGKGMMSLVFAVLRKAVLEIPALIILNRLFPLYGLPYAQTAAEIVLAFVSAASLLHMFKKTEREKQNN